jgi:hypothetical protein
VKKLNIGSYPMVGLFFLYEVLAARRQPAVG